MTRTQATSWLRQVQGQTLRNSSAVDDTDAWIALVRVPTAPGAGSRLIVAFGPTMEDATEAAEKRWHSYWRAAGPVN